MKDVCYRLGMRLMIEGVRLAIVPVACTNNVDFFTDPSFWSISSGEGFFHRGTTAEFMFCRRV